MGELVNLLPPYCAAKMVNRLCDLDDDETAMHHVPCDLGHMTGVSYKFKLFIARDALNYENYDPFLVSDMVCSAWLLLFKETRDAGEATRAIVHAFASCLHPLNEEAVEKMLCSNVNTVPAVDLFERQSIPFNRLPRAPSHVVVCVNRVQLLLPSNADCTHLYAAAEIVFQKESSFRLVHIDDGQEISMASNINLRDLANVPLVTEPVNLFAELFAKNDDPVVPVVAVDS